MVAYRESLQERRGIGVVLQLAVNLGSRYRGIYYRHKIYWFRSRETRWCFDRDLKKILDKSP